MQAKCWVFILISLFLNINALSLVDTDYLTTMIPRLEQEYQSLQIPRVPFFNSIIDKWDQSSSSNDLKSLHGHRESIFSNDELDFLAYEFSKKTSNVHIVIVWPRAKCHEQYILNELRKDGRLVYSKDVAVRGRAIPHILQTIPEKAKSIAEHLQYYFNNEPFGNLTVVLCTFPSLEIAVKCKLRIRQHLNLNPPIAALHVTDTQKQSIDLARIFFNKNSIWYLNHNFSFSQFEKYNFLIQKYKNVLRGISFDHDYCCVDGSAILAMHGIRDVNVDFDFLTSVSNIKVSQETFSFKNTRLGPLDIHNDAWVKAGVDPIETILNPQHHFYYQGIKFTSIERIRHFKDCQNRPVDRKDVEKIDELIRSTRI